MISLAQSFDDKVTRIGMGGEGKVMRKQSEYFQQFWMNKVLIIINVRLGMESISENYFSTIKKYMKFP